MKASIAGAGVFKFCVGALALICIAGCSSALSSDLEVINSSTIPIYVWVDEAYKGSIPVGGSQVWEVSQGSHTMRVTKSTNYGDSPAERFFNVDGGERCQITVYDW